MPTAAIAPSAAATTANWTRRGIAGDKQARNTGPLVIAGLDRVAAAQIADELDGQLRGLLCLGTEKQGLTSKDAVVLEADPLKAQLAALQTSNGMFNDPDATPV